MDDVGIGADGAVAGNACVAEAADAPAAQRHVARRAPRKPAKKPAKRRAIAFSKKRAACFLETLARMTNVAEACRVSGLSESTVYRQRRKDADFLARWHEALREGVARLEAEMLDRALNGVEKAVWHGGKQVGSVRHYNDALAMALLRVHGPAAGRAPPAPAASKAEETAELAEWLGQMNRRMGGAG